MQTPWVRPIKASGVLKVFNGTSGHWVNVFRHAMDAFNDLSEKNGLGVKLEKAATEKAANVVIKLATKKGASFTYMRTEVKESFPGAAVHGITDLFKDGRTGEVEEAVIFLPADTSDMNLKIMEVVMVHEFIHACGLDNDEHGNDGVFYSPLEKSDGRMIVPELKKKDLPMPPERLDPGTVSKIQRLWSTGPATP